MPSPTIKTPVAVFKKESAKKRMVWAEVYAPNIPDSDNEFMRAEEIERMAYDFMRAMKMDAVDYAHSQKEEPGCCVIESFIARPGDPDFIEGAWVVGIHVNNDEMWDKVEKGEINGFSMEAWVKREETVVDVEIPPVVQGHTMKAGDDDHEHVFHVAFDEEGNFLGGKTDTIDGHFHVIKRGTITETAGGHAHRFRSMENIKVV